MKSWSGVAVTIGQSGCPDRTGDYTSLGGVVAEAHARATPVYPSASGRDNGGRAADQRVTNSQSSKEEHGLAATREAEPEARRRRVVRAPPGRRRGRQRVVRRR